MFSKIVMMFLKEMNVQKKIKTTTVDCNGSDRTARQSSYRKYPKLNRVNSILKKKKNIFVSH